MCCLNEYARGRIECSISQACSVDSSRVEEVTTFLPTSFHAGQHVSHYGDTGLPELLKAYGVTHGMASTEGFRGIAVPNYYPSRGRGIESKRKRRHGSPMRSKMQLKSLAAGYARRKDRRGKPQAPAASDTAITLFARSVHDTTAENLESEYYDAGLLSSLLDLKPFFKTEAKPNR